MPDREKIVDMALDEYLKAGKKFGLTFNSSHEAIAVISEEMEETRDEFKDLFDKVGEIWESVKQDDEDTYRSKNYEACESAVRMIQESVQLLAMLIKARQGKDLFKKGETNE